MSIKTWQERLAKITSTSYQGYASQEEIDACKQAELDEIRSELARRTGEIAQLTETSLWQAGRISELLDAVAAQRKVLEQALFQSAPAIAGGRCRILKVHRSHLCCFNPRPPLLAGDACPDM